jgi:RNA polymerase sigma-54 factor
MERALLQEQIDNPTFHVEEMPLCPCCSARLYRNVCPNCQQFSLPATSGASEVAPTWKSQLPANDFDNYGFAQIDNNEDMDPLVSLPQALPLSEILQQQLAMLISPADTPIAEQLVGNLNERGYLEIGVEEIAQRLEVPIAAVEMVLQQLQSLDPPGIGARSLRECLLIQLDALQLINKPHPLARVLVEKYLEPLGRNHFHEIARQLNVTEQAVREGSRYIRSALHPFPAHLYQSESSYACPDPAVIYIRPDVIFRQSVHGYDVELVERRRYHLTISTHEPGEVLTEPPPSSVEWPPEPLAAPEVERYVHLQCERAQFFLDCVRRRWHTLHRVALLLADYQQEFLMHGVRFLRPLTRTELATQLGLDESTVSRAIANKYAMLPDGRLIPLSDFFQGSLRVKDRIRELIQAEEPKHRLSDEEIARMLSNSGYPMARRTVTKYREEMGIGSSRER